MPVATTAVAAPPPAVLAGPPAPAIDPVVWSVVLLVTVLVPAALAAIFHPPTRSRR
jgi:hypothetical protein